MPTLAPAPTPVPSLAPAPAPAPGDPPPPGILRLHGLRSVRGDQVQLPGVGAGGRGYGQDCHSQEVGGHWVYTLEGQLAKLHTIVGFGKEV